MIIYVDIDNTICNTPRATVSWVVNIQELKHKKNHHMIYSYVTKQKG
jgi:hypothetical protein